MDQLKKLKKMIRKLNRQILIQKKTIKELRQVIKKYVDKRNDN